MEGTVKKALGDSSMMNENEVRCLLTSLEIVQDEANEDVKVAVSIAVKFLHKVLKMDQKKEVEAK